MPPGGIDARTGDGTEVMSMSQQFELDDLMALYEQLGASGEPVEERRRHPRTFAKGHVPATLEVGGGGAMPIAVSVRDMSRSGIGVFAPNPIRVGERVTVSFRLGVGSVRATCRVANCREDDGGRYVVGMAFVEVRRPSEPTPQQQDPASVAAGAAGDGLEGGRVVSAMEAVRGADTGHVEDVVQRLRRTMLSS